MALSIKGIGSQVTRVNEITPEFDAHLLRWLTGYDKAILKNHLGELAVTRSGNAINIAAGVFFVYGYACYNSAITTLTQQYGTGTSYAYVYLNIDLSGATGKFEIKLTTPSTSESYAWTQNNLYTNPVGRYQQPIALLVITASNITVFDGRADLLKAYPQNAKVADDYSTAGTIKTKFDSVDAVAATKAPIASPTFTGTPTITSIPSTTTQVANLNGNKGTEVTQGGTLAAGFYRVQLGGGAGATGGHNGSRETEGGRGGNGGSLNVVVYVPFSATYRISAGGGGTNGTSGTIGTRTAGGDGGGGGGASVFLVPQLGIILAAYGGGGGSGAGGQGQTSGNGVHAQTGGAGGDGGIVSSGTTGNDGGTLSAGSGYAGAGMNRNIVGIYNIVGGVSGGGTGAANAAANNGASGGNNVDIYTGGGAVWTDPDAGNGYARLYRLT
jgi:hypothetical protein